MSPCLSLLALLAGGPRSATHLERRWSALTGTTLGPGAVGEALTGFEREGWITTSGGDEAIYSLTDAGRAAVHDWWLTASPRPKPGGDELPVKICLALADPDVDVLALLDRQRRATLTALHELTLASGSPGPELTAERLRTERRILDLEADIRWLDRVEALTGQLLAPTVPKG